MRIGRPNERTAAGSSRRLAVHVLLPLVVGGVILVAALSAVAALVARSSASDGLDRRAASARVSVEHALRSGGDDAARTAIRGLRRDGLAAELTRAAAPRQPQVAEERERRTYTFRVRPGGRDASRTLRIALPSQPVAKAGTRALSLAAGIGIALLLLVTALVGRAVRRSAAAPLAELAAAVEGVRSGRRAGPLPAGGAREVRRVDERLGELMELMIELEAQATTDPLTGVANRRGFHAALDTELKRAERESATVALVILDLDGFKAINDAHGHPFGDGVLQVVAEQLRNALRATDALARVGGDEFAILLPGTSPERATAIVERAREQAADSVGGIELTWCAGVASFPADARAAGTLVECADSALYCAKTGGEARICHYDPEEAIAPRIEGERTGIEALLELPDAIVPVFQPLVSLATGEISGYEALARFPHPPARRPDEWFAMATQCGLGPALEARAVQEALARPGRPPGTYLSFNLSASALLSDEVAAIMPDDLTDIVIEITENERVGDDDRLAAAIAPLRRRGARIAIDDAGAGYSGLQQVMRLQPDIIKLDRSLVGGVDTDPAKAALIDSFVRFARRTGAVVCAEGIETSEELKVLADLDVTYGQGFGLARPAAPWASIATWVPGTARSRALRADREEGQATDAGANSDLRLAQLSTRLANVVSADDLPAITRQIAAELGADDVCLLRRAGADALEAVTDQRWLPAGRHMSLAYYPTMKKVLASQEAVQVIATDAGADLGELALLAQSGYGSMLVAPVVHHAQVVGVFLGFSERDRPWPRAEASRARVLAHQVGSLLEEGSQLERHPGVNGDGPLTLVPPEPV